MIEARGLTKRFGQLVAVGDLTFSVRPGEATGFLGRNEAGKPVTELRHSLPPECTWRNAEFALEGLGEASSDE
jgi:ABC-type uncharacterized transport system ATPase subunit